MIAEFIGQGLTDDTENSTGNYVCSSLNSEVFDNINFFVAFLRSKGLKELKPFIKKAKSEKRQITIFVGIDEKITSKEALEMLLDLGIESYIYNSRKFIYHPKIYLFEGKVRNRIIIGSSNLTKTGLFYNVEASVLLDFTSEDKSGNKVLNQLKDYFSPLLEFTSDDLDVVTQDYIDYLFEKGLISSEKKTDYDGEGYDFPKDKFKIPKIGKLGDIEITDKPYKPSTKYVDKITEEYLEKWDAMFERMKAYKEKFGRTTVSKNHYDRTLFGWYQKQKRIYNNPDIEMPIEHITKLNSIDFYFGDGHEERTDFIRKKWLRLLKRAIKDGEDIRQDHRYTYKNETLGTWLQQSKSDPETRKLIEEAGFDYTKKSRKIEYSSKRFLEDLLNDNNPEKVEYQKRFNARILPRKDKIPEEIKTDISVAWELQFSEKRSWDKITRQKDRTEEWKAFRYNLELNPKGRWIVGVSTMGKLYNWVYHKKKSKKKMDLVIDKFNDTEIVELKAEGFPID